MKVTPKTWGLVACYDATDYRKRSYREDMCNRHDSQSLLPNVPMRAKNTLLASLLRTGHYMGKQDRVREPRRDLVRLAKQTKLGQLLGVEIEYYPKHSLQSTPLCNIAGDGSLNSGGQEIRKLTWADSSGRLAGLLALRLDGKVDKTCGLHVHVDARHLGQNGLLSAEDTYDRLILLYRHLKYLCPKSRRRNRYCKWVDNRTCASSRYSAINWFAFNEHSTIEFRCQGGSINVTKIESWALICQYLLNFCARPENTVPRTWKQFTAILPEPLRSWCILRREKLYGSNPQVSDRALSAILD